MTRSRAPRREQPSTRAASSSSSGIASRKAGQQPDGQRQADGGVRQGDGEPAIDQLEGPHQGEHGDRDRDIGHHAGHQGDEQEDAPRAAPAAHHRPGGRQGQRQGQRRAQDADDGAIQESARHAGILAEAAVAIHPELLREDMRRDGDGVFGRLEGGQQQVSVGAQVEQQHEEHQGVEQDTTGRQRGQAHESPRHWTGRQMLKKASRLSTSSASRKRVAMAEAKPTSP